MTNINGIQKMVVGSTDWEKIHKMTGNYDPSKVNDEETLFQTMQYYEASNRSDAWSVDAQNLSVEELIKLWQEFDKEETSFAQDFDDFDAFLNSYKKDEPPVDEDIIRPYIPDPNLPPEVIDRMNDFDYMRANDIRTNLTEAGDYEVLLEYVRQREGTSFLTPSDYNADGTVNDKGKAKEAEMVAKLQELDVADSNNTIGNIMEGFLAAYGVNEPTGPATNGELPDVKDVLKGVPAKGSAQLTIGDNIYLVTNKGAEGNELAYEVKTNKQGEKYIEMTGDNWRIQDISGQLQDDLIQVIGNGNELDLGLGNDIAHLVGDGNRALMGDGNDKVYIEGDENFSDLWRGDDQMFNINSDKTLGVGFTGDDEFYIKGDNVTLSGESNNAVGDGLYEDGVVTDYEIENKLTKPDWFPKDDEPPVDPDPEKTIITDDDEVEIDGIKYMVYRKPDTDIAENLAYYKAEDGRTVFESNGWTIKVVSEFNETGDEKYADVVIQGTGNNFWGSNGDDNVEIQGDKNRIYGDLSDTAGGDDNILITSGTGNRVYGESGDDELVTKTEGNFFNGAIKDVEKVNNAEQDLTVPQKPSAWQTVTNPNDSQVAQMEAAKEAFGLAADATVKGVKQNGSFLGMTIDGKAYISETDANGKIETITQKTGTTVTAKIDYAYSNAGTTTTMTNYTDNSKTVTKPDGSKTVTVYDDVKATKPTIISQIAYDAEGNVVSDANTNKETNTIVNKAPDGTTTETIYDDVTLTNKKPQTEVKKDANGNVISTSNYDYENNTKTTDNADGTKSVSKYTNLTTGESTIESTEHYDAEGNLTSKDTFKQGKLDMTFPQGDVMSIEDFFKAADFNNDKKVTANELKQLYNRTNDPTLKGILSNFTNGVEMTFAFELASTTTGRNAYVNGNNSIENGTADISMIAKDGMITSDSLAKLQNDAAYAALVGYEVGNAWYVGGNNNDGQMYPSHPAYALTNNDGKDYDQLTMTFLNQVGGGTTINRDDLAKFGITTAEDFTNPELFNTLREASDLVGELGATVTVNGGLLNRPVSRTVSPVKAQGILDTFNKTDNQQLKELCLASGAITVGADNIARISQGMTNTSLVDSYALYMKALEILEYPNLEFEADEEAEE